VRLSSDRSAISLEEAQEAKRQYRKRHTRKVKQIIASGKKDLDKIGEIVKLEAAQKSQIPSVDPLPAPRTATPVNNDRGMAEVLDLMRQMGY
jgi:hypothetical protein